jgi:hypothetical protein
LSFVSAPPSNSSILVRAFLDAVSGVTGSVTGSFIGSVEANALILPTSAPVTPQTGSVYFDGSFIYVYTGTQYKSASLV